MSLKVPVTINIPLDIILVIKNDERPDIALNQLLPDVDKHVAAAITEIPLDMRRANNTKSKSSSSNFAITVKIINGRSFSLSVSEQTSIKEVAEMIEAEDGMAAGRQRLFFRAVEVYGVYSWGGEQVKRCLGELGIGDGAVLVVGGRGF